MQIGFNKPYFTGKEIEYILEAVQNRKISGDGAFTKKCHQFFEQRYQFPKTLLTTSCTDALEMAAILINTQPGDEIIMPSFTFVSTANAFVLRGAKIVFADCRSDIPNLDEDTLEQLITSKTKAIVPVHYAGISCNMDKIMEIATKHNLYVIEDAAQSIESFYKGKPLGGIGHLAAFSFHETKNIISGEGGMLAINDKKFIQRAEIIREKGTNRSQFFRGEVDKYNWVDIGSSFLPSEITAAFLFAQLEQLDVIQHKRKTLWDTYEKVLRPLMAGGYIGLPVIPPYATNNAHMFYLTTASLELRDELISFLKSKGINAVFHYISLHASPFYRDKHDGRELCNSDNFTDTLVRLPMYFELEESSIHKICKFIYDFFKAEYPF